MNTRSDLWLGVASHVGKRRTANEDDLVIFEPKDPVLFGEVGRILAIADGVGGTRGGAEASRIAIRAMLAAYVEGRGAGKGNGEARMVGAFREASKRVYDASVENPYLRGMGTTLVAVRLMDGWAEIGHVGDSRCLLVREGSVLHLTEDHTAGGAGTELTRCIGGGRPDEVVDFKRQQVRAGDRIVLCTDGLWSTVADEEIEEIVSEWDPKHAAGELISRANSRGGPDNATVIVGRVERVSNAEESDSDEASHRVEVLTELDLPEDTDRVRAPSRPARWPKVLILLALLVGGLAVAKLAGLLDLRKWALAQIERLQR